MFLTLLASFLFSSNNNTDVLILGAQPSEPYKQKWINNPQVYFLDLHPLRPLQDGTYLHQRFYQANFEKIDEMRAAIGDKKFSMIAFDFYTFSFTQVIKILSNFYEFLTDEGSIIVPVFYRDKDPETWISLGKAFDFFESSLKEGGVEFKIISGEERWGEPLSSLNTIYDIHREAAEKYYRSSTGPITIASYFVVSKLRPQQESSLP